MKPKLYDGVIHERESWQLPKLVHQGGNMRLVTGHVRLEPHGKSGVTMYKSHRCAKTWTTVVVYKLAN